MISLPLQLLQRLVQWLLACRCFSVCWVGLLQKLDRKPRSLVRFFLRWEYRLMWNVCRLAQFPFATLHRGVRSWLLHWPRFLRLGIWENKKPCVYEADFSSLVDNFLAVWQRRPWELLPTTPMGAILLVWTTKQFWLSLCTGIYSPVADPASWRFPVMIHGTYKLMHATNLARVAFFLGLVLCSSTLRDRKFHSSHNDLEMKCSRGSTLLEKRRPFMSPSSLHFSAPSLSGCLAFPTQLWYTQTTMRCVTR